MSSVTASVLILRYKTVLPQDTSKSKLFFFFPSFRWLEFSCQPNRKDKEDDNSLEF